MTWVALALAFAAFTGAIWSAHAVNRHAAARYGYAPFSLPNALFMLIPHGLLLYALATGGAGSELAVTLAGAGLLALFLIVRRRTNGWIGLYAASLLLIGASVLAVSLFFTGLAGSDEPT
ncbi:MAG: hypothetical protein MUC77_18475 [Chromatiaceae bacterium]|jgi:hypothetical protein|nr:hypothetical protein [Chromatiaceae bacterium]